MPTLGRHFGRPYLAKRKGNWIQVAIQKSDAFYLKWGWWAVVIGRFMPWARVFVPVIAGISRMNYYKFFSANLVGAVGWGMGLTITGYFAATIPAVKNASYGIAAFFVLADAATAVKAGQKPLARIVSYAVAGVPNHEMGEGPIPATQLALKKAGLKLDQMDVIESNEAFAAQALSVSKVLGLDPAKTNPNGGAIALGHPLGASGAIITVKCLYELMRTQKRYGLVTMCIGGGQGIAAVFERL